MTAKALLLLAFFVPACAGAPSEATKPAASPDASGPRGHRVSGDPIAGTPVYDERGQKSACAPPKPSCPDAAATSIDFKDRCRLAGYRVMQCGCDELCTGNIASEKLGYDAQNTAKACEPENKDCTPPETSAAFQDACTESGHRFVVCGCEWLCSGKLPSPVPAKSSE
jgi:hypothetical protein